MNQPTIYSHGYTMYNKIVIFIMDGNKVLSAQTNLIDKIELVDIKNHGIKDGIKIELFGAGAIVIDFIDEQLSICPVDILENIKELSNKWGFYVPSVFDYSLFVSSDHKYMYMLLKYVSQIYIKRENYKITKALYEDPNSQLKKNYGMLWPGKEFPDENYIYEQPILRCPICEKELVVAGYSHLETLEEHVSDPNGECTLKPVLVCNNNYCLASILDFGWDDTEGGLYNLSTSINGNHIKFKYSDNSSAINSFGWKFEEENKEKEKHTHRFQLTKNFRIILYLVKNPLDCSIIFVKNYIHGRTYGINHWLNWRKFKKSKMYKVMHK